MTLKYLVVRNTTSRVPSTTVYHRLGPALLEAYDLFGRKVFEQKVIQGSGPVEVDVSLWQKGMYVFRLVFRGETVAIEKVVVSR